METHNIISDEQKGLFLASSINRGSEKIVSLEMAIQHETWGK